MKLTDSQQMAQRIGEFYLAKNNGDYDATAVELERLLITDIVVTSERTEIHLGRPGLLIGIRGKTIEQLAEYLGVNVHIVETNHWLDYLVPCPPCVDDFEEDYYFPLPEEE